MKPFYKIFFLLAFVFLLGMGFQQVSAQQENNTKLITNQDKAITVYPVPARTVAHIRLSQTLKDEVDKIEIINLIGRKVTEQKIIDKNATEITFTNLNTMPAGIYMVVTRDKYGKIVQSAKMIIDK
jgi:hypothetical protein